MQKFRFHLVNLPHTRVSREFGSCAFSEKCRKFAIMMMDLGHEVYLYAAGEETDAPCTEFISCFREDERLACLGGLHYTQGRFLPHEWHWNIFNERARLAISQRVKPRDFICIGGGGTCQMDLQMPGTICVEYGIGYGGTFAKHRVWESYAWMHTCYGARTFNAPNAAKGEWYDAVIPSYFEPEAFTFQEKKSDYALFIGRMIDCKGYHIAEDVCKELGIKLLLAGAGDTSQIRYGEHVGVVQPAERDKLMREACMQFVPTTYIEPFGSVAVEGQGCGTPILSTDWGAFVETVPHGVVGYRCRTLKEFVQGAKQILDGKIDPKACRANFDKNYTLDVIKWRYHDYFEKLYTLWGDGWYAK